MTSYAFFKNEFVPLSEAKVGIMTHCFHYGTALFEGIRGNWNAKQEQLYLFRLREHYQRLYRGCQMLKVELGHSIDELCQITVEMVAKSGFREDIYIRPVAYKSTEALGVRLHNLEHDFFVLAFPWGPYLDMDKARCCVSSWRCAREVPRAKITGLYVTNAMAKTEAVENGFDEGIMLSSDGYVSEGTGENIFLVAGGTLVTPGSHDDILMGITRDTVIKLAKDELRLETRERHVTRSELYNADECFLTGTAAHITPVAEIDHRKIGDGEVGAVTGKLQEIYSGVIHGDVPKYRDWCTPVY